MTEKQIDLALGQRVTTLSNKTGLLRYFGSVTFAPGIWCGIELDESDGDNDGEIDYVRYFFCKKRHGLFCHVSEVLGEHSEYIDPDVSKIEENIKRLYLMESPHDHQKDINKPDKSLCSSNVIDKVVTDDSDESLGIISDSVLMGDETAEEGESSFEEKLLHEKCYSEQANLFAERENLNVTQVLYSPEQHDDLNLTKVIDFSEKRNMNVTQATSSSDQPGEFNTTVVFKHTTEIQPQSFETKVSFDKEFSSSVCCQSEILPHLNSKESPLYKTEGSPKYASTPKHEVNYTFILDDSPSSKQNLSPVSHLAAENDAIKKNISTSSSFTYLSSDKNMLNISQTTEKHVDFHHDLNKTFINPLNTTISITKGSEDTIEENMEQALNTTYEMKDKLAVLPNTKRLSKIEKQQKISENTKMLKVPKQIECSSASDIRCTKFDQKKTRKSMVMFKSSYESRDKLDNQNANRRNTLGSKSSIRDKLDNQNANRRNTLGSKSSISDKIVSDKSDKLSSSFSQKQHNVCGTGAIFKSKNPLARGVKKQSNDQSKKDTDVKSSKTKFATASKIPNVIQGIKVVPINLQAQHVEEYEYQPTSGDKDESKKEIGIKSSKTKSATASKIPNVIQGIKVVPINLQAQHVEEYEYQPTSENKDESKKERGIKSSKTKFATASKIPNVLQAMKAQHFEENEYQSTSENEDQSEEVDLWWKAMEIKFLASAIASKIPEVSQPMKFVPLNPQAQHFEEYEYQPTSEDKDESKKERGIKSSKTKFATASKIPNVLQGIKVVPINLQAQHVEEYEYQPTSEDKDESKKEIGIKSSKTKSATASKIPNVIQGIKVVPINLQAQHVEEYEYQPTSEDKDESKKEIGIKSSKTKSATASKIPNVIQGIKVVPINLQAQHVEEYEYQPTSEDKDESKKEIGIKSSKTKSATASKIPNVLQGIKVVPINLQAQHVEEYEYQPTSEDKDESKKEIGIKSSKTKSATASKIPNVLQGIKVVPINLQAQHVEEYEYQPTSEDKDESKKEIGIKSSKTKFATASKIPNVLQAMKVVPLNLQAQHFEENEYQSTSEDEDQSTSEDEDQSEEVDRYWKAIENKILQSAIASKIPEVSQPMKFVPLNPQAQHFEEYEYQSTSEDKDQSKEETGIKSSKITFTTASKIPEVSQAQHCEEYEYQSTSEDKHIFSLNETMLQTKLASDIEEKVPEKGSIKTKHTISKISKDSCKFQKTSVPSLRPRCELTDEFRSTEKQNVSLGKTILQTNLAPDIKEKVPEKGSIKTKHTTSKISKGSSKFQKAKISPSTLGLTVESIDLTKLLPANPKKKTFASPKKKTFAKSSFLSRHSTKPAKNVSNSGKKLGQLRRKGYINLSSWTMIDNKLTYVKNGSFNDFAPAFPIRTILEAQARHRLGALGTKLVWNMKPDVYELIKSELDKGEVRVKVSRKIKQGKVSRKRKGSRKFPKTPLESISEMTEPIDEFPSFKDYEGQNVSSDKTILETKLADTEDGVAGKNSIKTSTTAEISKDSSEFQKTEVSSKDIDGLTVEDVDLTKLPSISKSWPRHGVLDKFRSKIPSFAMYKPDIRMIDEPKANVKEEKLTLEQAEQYRMQCKSESTTSVPKTTAVKPFTEEGTGYHGLEEKSILPPQDRQGLSCSADTSFKLPKISMTVGKSIKTEADVRSEGDIRQLWKPTLKETQNKKKDTENANLTTKGVFQRLVLPPIKKEGDTFK